MSGGGEEGAKFEDKTMNEIYGGSDEGWGGVTCSRQGHDSPFSDFYTYVDGRCQWCE
jgi:hypothetical protein